MEEEEMHGWMRIKENGAEKIRWRWKRVIG